MGTLYKERTINIRRTLENLSDHHNYMWQEERVLYSTSQTIRATVPFIPHDYTSSLSLADDNLIPAIIVND